MVQRENMPIFDKTITIEFDSLSEFAENPREFLDRNGFLDGLPGFNGLIFPEGINDIAELKIYIQEYRASNPGSRGTTIWAHTFGPVADFCKTKVIAILH